MKKISLFLVFFISFNALSQTIVQGGIYSDVIWTLSQSPYFVVGDIVVFPQKTLTIEPGVNIFVTGNYFLEIRGNLLALGNYSNRIEFKRDSINQNDTSWIGVRIRTDQNATADFKYCSFSNMSQGINEYCCNHQNAVSYKNIIFKNNFFAISGYNDYHHVIDSCEFYNNYIAITNADKNISNSKFINNVYGLYQTERINIDSSYFGGNETAIFGGRGHITNTLIENNGIGVRGFYEGFEITKTKILNNEIGLQVNSYDNFYPPVKNNEICYNSLYNVENLDDVNKDITQNCWCITDSAEIEAKLYDGYDNIYRGLLNYSIYDSTCSIELQRVIKIILTTADEKSVIENYILFQNHPNPFNPTTKIKFQTANFELVSLILYDILGKEVATLVNEEKPAGEYEFEFNAVNLPSGIYFYQLKAGAFTEIKKMVLLK